MNPHEHDARPLVIVLVGKPARGKSYTAAKLASYLTWVGYRARIFNVGAYRRELLGPGQDHSFFDPHNASGLDARRQMASRAMDDLVAWVRGGGQIALYDATNSTRARRAWVRNRCSDARLEVLFLELVCEDGAVIEANIRETKVTSPDYANADPDDAVRDFRARIAHYESAYEPISDEDGSYIQLIDAGRKLVSHRVQGYRSARLVTYLMHLHLSRRPIYLTRHGESQFNTRGLIGGDSGLSGAGKAYAGRLAQFTDRELTGPFELWTSSLRRTIETGSWVSEHSRVWRALDEIDAGVCDGMTYAEIAEKMPQDYAARKADKLRYRYPRGESYQDVINRLESVVFELERARDPIVVVAHQAVLRALYGYLQQIPPVRCPHLDMPLHTVIRLTPGPYGCAEQRFSLGPDPADWGGSG